jgi:hypothetical protein
MEFRMNYLCLSAELEERLGLRLSTRYFLNNSKFVTEINFICYIITSIVVNCDVQVVKKLELLGKTEKKLLKN